jgi:hypothetical protein
LNALEAEYVNELAAAMEDLWIWVSTGGALPEARPMDLGISNNIVHDDFGEVAVLRRRIKVCTKKTCMRLAIEARFDPDRVIMVRYNEHGDAMAQYQFKIPGEE